MWNRENLIYVGAFLGSASAGILLRILIRR